MRLIALMAFALVLAFAAGAATSRSQPTPAFLNYACTTTQADGKVMPEHDTIEQLGLWQHGTARPLPGWSEPFYDYYLIHAHPPYTYIEIYPARGSYFIGTSAPRPGHAPSFNGSTWSIIFPANVGITYKYTQTPASPLSNQYTESFRIAYTDLTQDCTLTNAAPPPAPSVPSLLPAPVDYGDLVGSWNCNSPSNGQPENLTVTRLNPNWLQGRATDAASGRVVYEYNLFSIQSQQVLVRVNAAAGTYSIATSLSPLLDRSNWTVVYPTTKVGFTIEALSWSSLRPLRGGFRTVFADGDEVCTPVSGASSP